MDDPVAEILDQRAAMDGGVTAAVVLSLLAHGALSALAVWAAWHHTAPQIPSVVTIKFAQAAPSIQAAPPSEPPVVAAPAPAHALTKPAPPATVVAAATAKPSQKIIKPVLPSPYGKSTSKATPGSGPALHVPVGAATTTSAAAFSSAQPQIAVGGTGVAALEGGDFPYSLYIDRMKTLIGSRWFRGEVGGNLTTTVYFVIERDGTLRDARTETSSGNGTFDRAALRAVLESSPLPPLPFGYSGTYLGVHLNFR